MAETVIQSVTLDDGTVVEARINRRGCKGPWTEESARHMAALIKAVHEQHRASRGSTEGTVISPEMSPSAVSPAIPTNEPEQK